MTNVLDFAARPFRTLRMERATPDLAIVVPTLNERDNIEPLLRAIDALGLDAEILFVDDWSADGTPEIVTAIARARGDVRLIRRHGRRGLASAVVEGALATTADLVAVIDADLQHDEALLPAMVAALRDGAADLAIGSRYGEGGSCGDWAEGRARASRAATRLAHLALGRSVADPLSGFFVIRREILTELAPRLEPRGFKILLDILGHAPPGLRVREFPYRFRQRTTGESKLGAGVAFDYARLIARGALRRLARARLALFCLVGLLGLAVNLAVLRVALPWLGFAGAQASAVSVAIVSNFLLNNALTYRDRRLRGHRLLAGLASFFLVCGAGALANVGVGSIVFGGGERWWVAGLAGAIVGAGWNFLASAAITWRRPAD